MGGMLCAPITSKHISRAGSETMAVASAEMQGWRLNMEDGLTTRLSLSSTHPKRSFFGVYDGHGGTAASAFLVEKMADAVGALADPTSPQELTKACLDIDAEFLQSQLRVHGSTCVFSVVTPLENKKGQYQITTANIGDSRALLVRADGKVEALTVDHKPTTSTEMERIAKAGGSVLNARVDGNLALSRAIGDYGYKNNRSLGPSEQKVIACPEVTSVVASEGDFLLICCDGLFEQMTSDQVGAFVKDRLEDTKYQDLGAVLADLLDFSVRQGSKDNMSALVCCFRDGLSALKNQPTKQFIPGEYLKHKKNGGFRQSYLKDAAKSGWDESKIISVLQQQAAGQGGGEADSANKGDEWD